LNFLWSSLHLKVDPASVDLNLNVGESSPLLFFGRFLIFVLGGPVPVQGVSVGVAALLRPIGVPSAKSAALLLVSSAESSRVAQPRVIAAIDHRRYRHLHGPLVGCRRDGHLPGQLDRPGDRHLPHARSAVAGRLANGGARPGRGTP